MTILWSIGMADKALPAWSSGQVYDPSYADVLSHPVSSEHQDPWAITSPPTSCFDSRASIQSNESASSDSPYVDASSTDALLYEVRQAADINSTIDVSINSNDISNKDDEHVYFVLDKTETLVSSTESIFTVKPAMENSENNIRAKGPGLVNVAQRMKMFEPNSAPMKAFTNRTDVKGGHEIAYQRSEGGAVISDIPPALQTGGGTHSARAASCNSGDIYEIKFDSDADNQSSRSLQNSFDGSGAYEPVGRAELTKSAGSKMSPYELARPLSSSGPGSPIRPVTGCKQGIYRQDFIQGPVPSQQEISAEYNRLQFGHSGDRNSSQIETQYQSLIHLSDLPKDPSEDEPLYEDPSLVRNRYSLLSEDCSDASWPSSDFDEEDDEDGYQAEAEAPAPNKPLPRKPVDSLQRFPGFSRWRNSNPKLPSEEDANSVCLPVHINTSKHPPPELPPAPPHLTEAQKKCRCVIDLTISSEKSYIDSLERILQEYEKPILEVIQNPKAYVRIVFRETREILNHHKMFQIELSETVKRWDTEEKIGDIFTASFSKSMLVDAYSIYVNNFTVGMDEIRTAQQSRTNFEEFLKTKEKYSLDRLSIFGLMVKPIQRFPQFIMLLQDLIKYTPHNHHDRRALQLALTELENVAHKLNERKRLCEQYFQAKQTMQLLPKQLPSQVLSGRKAEKPRRLIRFDNFDQIDGEMESIKSSSRRLILMDDMLICVKVGLKDQDGFTMERYRLKWAVRLSDIDLKDAAMIPDMGNVVKMDHKRLAVLSSQLEKPSEDPFHLYADLRDMLHDLTLFGQITTLMQSLHRSYQGYNMSGELFHEVISDLQRLIQIKDEQLRLVNSCSIILVDNSKADRPHYVMQSPTAAVKHEWCIDFTMAKLSPEKQNRPGWDRSPLAGSDDLDLDPAMFMKCVPVDVPRNFTKVKCATPVFLPSVPNVSTLGVQHLWVCASTSIRGQVSIISLHNTRPVLTESFKACDCEILCAEVVSGCGTDTNAEKFRFQEDTVWMSNVKNEIVIFLQSSTGGATATRDPLAVVRVPGWVTCIKFVDERLFCGLVDGAVIVYSRNDAGEWCVKTSRTLQCGNAPIRCQLVMKDNLWIACGHVIHVVAIDSLKLLTKHVLSVDHESSIMQMVCCGVGLWVAFQDSATVRLFHMETMGNLQEMSVSNIINRVLAEKCGNTETRDCVVTCITASTGQLWIGTNMGLILTLPLPRLKDGVPLYRGNPSVSYHAHRGPVRFIIPVYLSSSVTDLHKNSSLRYKLRMRPSIRNRKREVLELEGQKDDKLLSSGTELEASQSSQKASSSQRQGNVRSGVNFEALPPHLSEVPEKMRDPVIKPHTERRFFNFKRGSKSNSLKPAKPRKLASKRSSSRTLSFRSELADRIKKNTVGRLQVRSMVDLRAEDDPDEVEMLFDNLLDAGQSSTDNDDDSIMEDFDDSSVRSDSTVVAAPDTDLNIKSHARVKKEKGKSLEGLDLVGASRPSVVFASNLDLPASQPESSRDNTRGPAASVTESEDVPRNEPSPAPEPPLLQPLSQSTEESHADCFPLKRMATIRAHTMRKTSASNAVMVLSGGDGYWDMNNVSSVSKNEDASLLFWLYKF